ncbi:MAG TPA: 2,3,4,5-tetrahydropyridine-2,6-dicarboxylate N-succinyltransferase [Acidobacteriota bacterium]|nr:2,3,4,5-tetrahydropyridine-2,6-dicarboxylate N-succinyltransferase [Acidobacteriota bacterium]
MEVIELQRRLKAAAGTKECPEDFDDWFFQFLAMLSSGRIRAAEPAPGGDWQVNRWVKQGILLGFRFGRLTDYSINDSFRYFDKHTFPLRPFRLDEGVRLVPGGTSVRSGAYLAPGVVVMPPSYVNVGAWVGQGTMIDSHVIVGSCAQVGARVHVSANAQIGGVLEPVGARPVIIEDDVLVGGAAGVYEGTLVRRRAVLGAGTILTASIPVYDLVRATVLRATAEHPLEIPEGAVVVPGSRPAGRSEFAQREGIHLQCAVIVKYRDASTDAAAALEEALR